MPFSQSTSTTVRRPRSPNFLSRADSEQFIAYCQAVLDRPQEMRTSIGEIRYAYLKRHIWAKYADRLTTVAYCDPDMRASLAIRKWLGAETRNEKTNRRLLETGVDFGYFTSDRLIAVASKFIRDMIGKVPRYLTGEYTGGASTRVKRSAVAIPEKFEGRPHATTLAAAYWGANALRWPLWGMINAQAFDPIPQESSVMFTVPKNAQIDRVACKEPEVNMWLQRALGLRLRKQLQAVGIDLTDQSRNQGLARDARKRGLSTLDLSSASDTISRELVRRLLPPEWYAVLDDVRVKSTVLPDGSVHTLNMFSSMGNGFTFELESLIFWALVRAVAYLTRTRGTISVFGDDIICPTAIARLVIQTFAYCGFTVNAQKSMIKGHYRESCGAHWYGTRDIKPVYIRARPRKLTDLIQLGNQLLEWVCGEEDPGDQPAAVWLILHKIAELVPSKFWGGQDFERSDAYVTGHAPRRRLVCKQERVEDVPQIGAYIAWMSGTAERLEQTSHFAPSEASEDAEWVSRPNRTWYQRETMSVVRHALSRLEEVANLCEITL